MKKIILWSVIAILSAGLAVAGCWWLARPQVILLKDGTRLTLLGITYGKHNVPPRIKINGRSVRRGGATIDSTNDIGVVWIEAQTKRNNWPNFQLIVSDPDNTEAGNTYAKSQTKVRNGRSVMGVRLDAFPRRHGKIILRIFNYGPRGQQLAKGQFVVSNPVHGPFPQWSPAQLPNAQSDGDLDVTLTNLDINATAPYTRYNGVPKNDPLNKVVQIGFDVEQKGRPATNWNPVQLIASDATGNDATAWMNQYNQDDSPSYMFQSILWPDEPAWKLRVEFSRTSGFSPDELWTVSNVPGKQGTQMDANQFWSYSGQKKPGFAEATVNGIHLKVYPAIEYNNSFNGMPGGANKVVTLAFYADPDPQSNGMRFTPLEVTDDQGHKLQNWGSGWGNGNYQFSFLESRTTQSLNFTIAVHKSRFVEFMVKPKQSGGT